ncbi:FAD-dependent oxidoreductase [Kocuria palustris]|uniref:FAD-dependent oxidoreductase n=1 Tax=Kocuria palustris TaxID=71999 RepID=UPI00344B3479
MPAKVPLYAELLVAGGGLSGCAAALTAGRSGVSVTLIEPTHMLGGQAGPAGVSAMDVTEHYGDMINAHGFWHEFRSRTIDFYRYRLHRHLNVSQYRDRSFSPNPIVVDRVLTQMLKEAGVRVIRNVRIESGDIRPGIAKVLTSSGPISARLVIDATEEGSIIRTSGIPHRLGRAILRPEGYSRPNLSKVAIQAITQTAMIRRYEPGSMPEELRVPEPPQGYDEYLPTIKRGYPFGPGSARQGHPNGFAGYRGAPDLAGEDYQGSEWERITRTSLNYLNDQPITASYLTDESARFRFERLAIERTLSILYYLQHDLGLDWSVVTDEGFADGPVLRDPRITAGLPEAIVRHFPPIAYQRESARIVGRSTMTGKSIFRRANRIAAQWDSSAIAVGTYPPDLHGGRDPEDLETDLGETLADKPSKWREGPFPIPLGSLIPHRSVPLIAAEKNISASRIAASAVRLHPTVCGIGQSAGALAALALIHGVPPAEVPTIAVQGLVLQLGAHLTHHPVRGLRRDDPDYAAVQLAITHGLVDTVEVPRSETSSVLRLDRDRAARLGQVLLEEYRHWIEPALGSAGSPANPSPVDPLD